MEAVLKCELSEVVHGSEVIDGLRCCNETQDTQIELLEEKIHYLLDYRVGSKYERFDDRQALLFAIENSHGEIEDAVTEIEVPEHINFPASSRHQPLFSKIYLVYYRMDFKFADFARDGFQSGSYAT